MSKKDSEFFRRGKEQNRATFAISNEFYRKELDRILATIDAGLDNEDLGTFAGGVAALAQYGHELFSLHMNMLGAAGGTVGSEGLKPYCVAVRDNFTDHSNKCVAILSTCKEPLAGKASLPTAKVKPTGSN